MTATVAPDKEPNPRFAMFMGDPETTRVIIPGQKIGRESSRRESESAPVTLTALRLSLPTKELVLQSSGDPAASLTDDKPVDCRFDLSVPEDATYTRPYFSRPDIEQSYYDISRQEISELAARTLSA